MSPKSPCVGALVSCTVVLGSAVDPEEGRPNGCFLEHRKADSRGNCGALALFLLCFDCLGSEVSDFALAYTLAVLYFLAPGLKQWG